MAQEKTSGKSGFLNEYFAEHPNAGKAEINNTWQKAGNEGTISDSLIYLVRTKLRLAGNGRRKKAGRTALVGKRTSSGPASRGGSAAEPNGRRTSPTNGRSGRTAGEPSTGPGATRRDRAQRLVDLESRIDELLEESQAAGALEDFEEMLRRARRILARSHED